MATDPEHGGEFLFNPRMHEPGPQTVLGKVYPDRRRRAGPRGARRPRAPSGDRRACGAQARAAFLRRRAAAGAGRAAGEALPRHRRRSEGDRQGAGRGAGDLGRAAHEAQAAERVADLGMARDRRSCRRGAPRPRRRMAYLGERFWRPHAPKGFADEQSAWIDGLAQRLDIANRIARAGAGADRAGGASSRTRSDRSRRPKRGRPSRAPKAASRRSRWR